MVRTGVVKLKFEKNSQFCCIRLPSGTSLYSFIFCNDCTILSPTLSIKTHKAGHSVVKSSSVVRGVANPIDHPHGVVKVKLWWSTICFSMVG
jgi:hypothetical protein